MAFSATSRGFGTGPNTTPGGGYGSFSGNTRPFVNKYLGGTALQSPYNISRFQGIADDMNKRLFANGVPWAPGSIGGGNGSFGFAGPNDPTLKGHLANLIGGTRQIATQATQDAAYAGPNRAGTGIVGGGDPRSIAAYNTAKAIGQSFGQNYGQAADLTFKGESQGLNAWNSAADLLKALYGNELGAEQGQARFLTDQANTGVALNAQDLQAAQGAEEFAKQKYFDQLQYDRGALDRAWQEKQRMMQYGDWITNRQNAQVARDKKASAEEEYKQMLLNYPGYRARFGSGGGFAPESYEEYMRVMLGMDDPLKRTINTNINAGATTQQNTYGSRNLG